MLCHDHGPVQSLSDFFSTMLKQISKSIIHQLIAALSITLLATSTAWAYKVEKICEDLPATAKEPAQKKCRVVRVKENAAPKGDGKAEAKKDDKAAAKK